MMSDSQYSGNHYLDERRSMIEKALSKALPSSDLNANSFIESMRYPLLGGGKRIRPILCLACCEMFGGDIEAALPTAIAIEMIHTMSLIHDDLPAMGNHSIRRGKPTIHTAFGEDIAILSGDALLAKAFEIIVQDSSKLAPEKVLQILGRLGSASGALGLAGNQACELACGTSGGSNNTVEQLEIRKTVALIKVSVALGAFVADAPASDILILEQYAENIGAAFHLTDLIIARGNIENSLVNIEKMRKEAVEYAAKAKDNIAVFGGSSQPLQLLADYVIHRIS